MANRSHAFAPGEHYHCYNRGTEKRPVFQDAQDYSYFLKSMKAYNSDKILGKLRLHSSSRAEQTPVTILSYCLLPNHFHILLRSNADGAVSKYMQRLGVGYTMYFNQKYKRQGSLFQGTFKSKHVETDQDIRQLLAYVSLNNLVHSITEPDSFRSNINVSDDLVRGLTSNYTDAQQREAVSIIKELRIGFDE